MPANPHDPVRHHVKPVSTTLRENFTVSEAIESLRGRKIDERIVYFYVVNAEGKLLGVVPTRRLLLADPSQRIEQVMHTPVTSIRADAPLSEAMEMFAKQRFLALPVVDNDGTFLGTVDVRLYADEAVDLAEAKREADVFQLIGVWVQRYEEGTAWRAYRIRMPWLTCNLIGGMICAMIAALFHQAAEMLVVAAFVPVVLTLSESIAIQSLTLGIQSMHASKIDWAELRQLARLEWKSAILLGATCGLVVGIAAYFWKNDIPAAPYVIGGSILFAMSLAALMGMLVPLILYMLRWDPKVAAGPVVLMFVDITTLSVYLASATNWLH